MQIGMVGLGRMGGNMVRRLRRAGIDVVAYDGSPEVTRSLAQETGAMAVASLPDMVKLLNAPRVVWLMLPAGDITHGYVEQYAQLLAPGDLLVDGANNYYRAAHGHAELLAQRGIQFVDAGVSGGIWGLDNGYCLMLGGSDQALALLRPVIEALAPAAGTGWVHCGPVGSGHFVKMVHNGIEYGMMQAMAEGFGLMAAKKEYGLDLADIAETWRHGSVVRSWLLDLTAEFLQDDQKLLSIEPYVADSGEGRWTVQECVDLGVPAPVMGLALMMRFASQGKGDYASRVLAMMRKGFGGHAVKAGGGS